MSTKSKRNYCKWNRDGYWRCSCEKEDDECLFEKTEYYLGDSYCKYCTGSFGICKSRKARADARKRMVK